MKRWRLWRLRRRLARLERCERDQVRQVRPSPMPPEYLVPVMLDPFAGPFWSPAVRASEGATVIAGNTVVGDLTITGVHGAPLETRPDIDGDKD